MKLLKLEAEAIHAFQRLGESLATLFSSKKPYIRIDSDDLNKIYKVFGFDLRQTMLDKVSLSKLGADGDLKKGQEARVLARVFNDQGKDIYHHLHFITQLKKPIRLPKRNAKESFLDRPSLDLDRPKDLKYIQEILQLENKIKELQVNEENTYPSYCKPSSLGNQSRLFKGVFIDPMLPDHFDNLDIEERSYEELEDWRGVYYIVSDTIIKDDELIHRYNVRCLDGGAWDRSTSRGMFFDNLDGALSLCKDEPLNVKGL